MTVARDPEAGKGEFRATNAMASQSLTIKPLVGLRAVGDKVGGKQQWVAEGSDPQFECVIGRNAPLPGGWYLMTLDIQASGDGFVMPVLYPDYGAGAEERTRVRLPSLENPELGTTSIVRFTSDVIHLRFDPSAAPVDFSLGQVTFRKMGKLEAASRMFQGAWRALAPRSQHVDMAKRVAKALFTGGPVRMAEVLYGEYSRCGDKPDTATDTYRRWIELYDKQERDGDLTRLKATPLISVVLPTYNPPEKWLRKCLDSVLAQSYPHWELCISDDASTQPHVRRVLEEYRRRDARIKIVFRPRNGHISESSNSAIEIATGSHVALLDHDDLLHPQALYEVAVALGRNPGLKIIFSDEDKVDQNGLRFDPYFKADWNPDLFLSHNCISHLGVYETALLRQIDGFRKGFEGSQDWDLALRCIERVGVDQIHHIPRVLYHWRAIPGSTALAPQEKDYAHDAGLRSIAEHLERTGSTGRVVEKPGYRGNYRVRYSLPVPRPLVSILIPTRDGLHHLKRCIDSIVARSTYPAYEIVVIDNQSSDPDALEYLRGLEREHIARVVPFDAAFNYSAINNFAASESTGSVLVLLNNDVEVITPDWLEELVGQALRPGVGAVGAMLYYPNETIQHAGVITGVHGAAAHPYSGKPRGWPGQMNRAKLQQNMTAVTAACLAVKREVWDQVGGLDPAFRVAYNDVDFCMRLGGLGLRNVWTPYAELYHHESATRGSDARPERVDEFERERALLLSRWAATIDMDPAYNPNLSATEELFSLSFPPKFWTGQSRQHAPN
jgi:glycosyltransferase involved in cell wall biosynthesis